MLPGVTGESINDRLVTRRWQCLYLITTIYYTECHWGSVRLTTTYIKSLKWNSDYIVCGYSMWRVSWKFYDFEYFESSRISRQFVTENHAENLLSTYYESVVNGFTCYTWEHYTTCYWIFLFRSFMSMSMLNPDTCRKWLMLHKHTSII